MEEEEGGLRLSKRFSDQGGEVDLKTKSGTAWSHNFLNQKPWHPLSYPNQRRKWIAEQTHAQRQRRAEEVSREFAQEQEFFRQAALVSKKEKEKLETMKAVSFMYVRPPGYNAESAKAAEISDEKMQHEGPSLDGESSSMPLDAISNQSRDEKKKKVPKDVFGRALPTEEQFEILKNAPRLETGAPARVKPFAVEVRNVKCLRCGTYGHQSGDRECPLKDAIMPNEESRLKRNDPLTAMLAHTDSSEPLKWELKQKPGMSPPRGGFNPDDPNQQIVAEDIFDEYGGFLSGEQIPELLANFSSSKPDKSSKSKKKHRRRSPPTYMVSKHRKGEGTSQDDDERKKLKKKTHETKKQKDYEPIPSIDAVFDRWGGSFDDDNERRRSRRADHQSPSPPIYTESKSKHRKGEGPSGDDDERMRSTKRKHKTKERRHYEASPADDEEFDRRNGSSDGDNERKRSKKGNHKRKKQKHSESSSSEDAELDRHHKRRRHGHSYSSSSEDSGYDGRHRSKHRHRSGHRRHHNRDHS
ncbi:hypothetical protein Vadar_015173 [Vaccinium darrowii]|uniref:Uncharacterized protein n=1 Tax=Vaccinium darrowii TaxID=229202 RepID=A0ACB7X1H7_9ERIC|nr:hypothetical protein Vadar_015173 [Vaccinium darrowii]